MKSTIEHSVHGGGRRATTHLTIQHRIRVGSGCLESAQFLSTHDTFLYLHRSASGTVGWRKRYTSSWRLRRLRHGRVPMDETMNALFHRKRISERISGREDFTNNFEVGRCTVGNSLVDLEPGGQLERHSKRCGVHCVRSQFN